MPQDHGLTHEPGTLDIVCVTDANYVPHFAALLKSIERNKGPERIRVHAILDGVAEPLLRKVAAAVPGLALIGYHVNDHQALTLPPLLQISRATYLRLIIDELIDPGYKRLLYLDIDMIVTGSLWELWSSDLQERACAAVSDPGIQPKDFAMRFGLSGDGAYLNAGTLLFDMDRARDLSIFAAALDHLLTDAGRFELADQDALNLVLWRRWTELDPRWNFQRKFLYADFAYDPQDRDPEKLPRVIHFTESAKPWQAQEWHPHAWLYWKYLRQTPFFAAVTATEHIGRLRVLKFWLKFLLRGRRLAKASS